MTEVASRCADAELLAAFIAGTLSPSELEQVSTHLLECPECRDIVGETARFEREELGSSGSVAEDAPMQWGLAAAAIIAIAIVAAPWVISQIRRASPMAQLAAAAPAGSRSIEPRVTGFGWAPMQRIVRGAGETPDPAQMKLVGTAAAVLEKTAEDSSPEAQHAAGVAHLLTNDTAGSLALLRSAAGATGDARIWSDLAAACYTAAVRDNSPERLKEALGAADRALAGDPKLPTALFNRALILERMGLQAAAKQAWQSYLSVEPNGDWAAEGHRHLMRLNRH